MPTVLITGANRGIGLDFARAYAAEGWEVIAANRTSLAPKDFVALGPDLREIRYDATDDASAAGLAARLAGRPLDVLILNAGISLDEDLPPEALTLTHWEKVIEVNTWAPFHLAALLEPNLRKGAAKKVVAISSLAASTGTYDRPRQFAYRASKAALNQLMRNLSIDWRDWGAIALMLRPGRVQTRMTGFDGPLTAAESVRGMKAVIDAAGPEQSGLHWGHDGQPVPW